MLFEVRVLRVLIICSAAIFASRAEAHRLQVVLLRAQRRLALLLLQLPVDKLLLVLGITDVNVDTCSKRSQDAYKLLQDGKATGPSGEWSFCEPNSKVQLFKDFRGELGKAQANCSKLSAAPQPLLEHFLIQIQ